MTTAARTRAELTTPYAFAVVDVVGVGSGVVDRLREDGFEVLAFNGGEQSGRTDITGAFTFKDDRSAAWWHLRELLDPSQKGGARIMLPDDEQLKADLIAPKWKHLGRRIAVEPKDDIRKRLGRSPDAGDMCVMAWWHTAGPVMNGDGGGYTPWGAGEDADVLDSFHAWSR
jgi:hypothetical protein